MGPEEIPGLIYFRHITDFPNKDEANDILESHQQTNSNKISKLESKINIII